MIWLKISRGAGAPPALEVLTRYHWTGLSARDNELMLLQQSRFWQGAMGCKGRSEWGIVLLLTMLGWCCGLHSACWLAAPSRSAAAEPSGIWDLRETTAPSSLSQEPSIVMSRDISAESEMTVLLALRDSHEKQA